MNSPNSAERSSSSPNLAWTTRWIAQCLGTKPESRADFVFSAILTDSRKIQSGCLFVPLKGENFDGHDFIESAVAHGARGFLYDRGRPCPRHPPEVRAFPVEDTQKAFRILGAEWRRLFPIPVALVAGSNGKTTTKEMLTALLKGRWPEVLKTQGSQNGFVGIPMTLLELRASHGAAVIEVGIDEAGAMEDHAKVVRPTAALVTMIGPEHMEKLHDLDTVAREEAAALTWTAAHGGKVAVNLDDPYLAPYFDRFDGSAKLGYTLHLGDGAPYTLRGQVSSDHRHLNVEGGGWFGEERFELPLPGRHNAANLLCAIATAHLLGLSPEEMRAGLKTFTGAEGRSQVLEIEGTTVICDYYNSQPASVTAGLDLLTQLAHRSRPARPRWACLADMLELGSGEERYHREVATELVNQKIENVLLYGPRMKWLADELRARGFSGLCRHFDDQKALADFLNENSPPGDVILIKGSRSMKMEEVWKALEKARA